MTQIVNQMSSCSTAELKNTGRPVCPTPEGLLKKIFVSKKDFYFDTSSDLPTVADIQEAIQDQDLFPLAIVDELEDTSDERQDYDATSGQSYKMKSAVQGIRPMFTLTAWEFVKYLSFNNITLRVFELDHKGFLKGTDMDGDSTKFAGFLTQRFDVENRTRPTDATTPVQTPVSIKYAEESEYRANIWVIGDMGAVGDLNGLLDCTITATDPTTSAVTLTVKTTATTSPVEGLNTDDFKILDDTGTAVTVSAATESSTTPGEYEVEATLTAGTYTGGLQDPSDMTTEGYDGGDLVEFTTS